MSKNLVDTVCTFRCKHAGHIKDTYCSDNVTIFCKRTGRVVRKWTPCPAYEEDQDDLLRSKYSCHGNLSSSRGNLSVINYYDYEETLKWIRGGKDMRMCNPKNCKYCYYRRKKPRTINGRKIYCALLA